MTQSLRNRRRKLVLPREFFIDRGSVDRNSVDRNCVLSLDRNFVNHLTEILDSFQLIESFNNDFGQTPKNWSVDRNFLN